MWLNLLCMLVYHLINAVTDRRQVQLHRRVDPSPQVASAPGCRLVVLVVLVALARAPGFARTGCWLAQLGSDARAVDFVTSRRFRHAT